MKRKILAAIALAVLVLTLFAGCESTEPTTVTNVTPEEAQEIVRLEMGLTAEEMLSPMIHIGEYGDPAESCYSIQFATRDQDYEFIISAIDGDILYRSDKVQ